MNAFNLVIILSNIDTRKKTYHLLGHHCLRIEFLLDQTFVAIRFSFIVHSTLQSDCLISPMTDDVDSIDLSDNDKFMLDVEIDPASVQDIINMGLAEDDSHSQQSQAITTNIDLPPLSIR